MLGKQGCACTFHIEEKARGKGECATATGINQAFQSLVFQGLTLALTQETALHKAGSLQQQHLMAG